ncbi:MAG TPA: type II toxin-antitoxin system prevent-host-death family antitoxin [Thermoanaerobaculia bacterium]|nr:type II toxin-antitoxin system prevent-host-death family antitoxin [Thermoanaerobaculia bacterium]
MTTEVCLHTLGQGWSTGSTEMSEVIYNLYEAKTSLSRLVDRAASGEEIILSKAGKPLAKLVPFHRPPEPRQPGGWEGRMRISEEFDAPLPPEIQAAFEGRE